MAGEPEEPQNQPRAIQLHEILQAVEDGLNGRQGSGDDTTADSQSYHLPAFQGYECEGKILTPSHIHSEVSENGVERRWFERVVKHEAVGSQKDQAKEYASAMDKYFPSLNQKAVLFTEHNIISGDGTRDGTPIGPIYSAEVSTSLGDVIVYTQDRGKLEELINNRKPVEDKSKFKKMAEKVAYTFNKIFNKKKYAELIQRREDERRQRMEDLSQILADIVNGGGVVIFAHPAFLPPNGTKTELEEADPRKIEKYPVYNLANAVVDKTNPERLPAIGVEIYNQTRLYEFSKNLAFALMLNKYASGTGKSSGGQTSTWFITPVAGSDSHTGHGRAFLELCYQDENGNLMLWPGMSYVIAPDPMYPLTRNYFRETMADERYTFRLPQSIMESRFGSKALSYLMEAAMKRGASFSGERMPYAFKKNGGYQPNGGIDELRRFMKSFTNYQVSAT